MTEALGAGVTPVTVRRNMIKQGIHEPHSNGSTTDTEGTDPEPDAETDDVDRADDEATDTDRTRPESGDSVENESPDDVAPADHGNTSNDTSRSTNDDSPSTEEGSTESTDEPVAVPDGIGLPNDLDFDQLTAVVSTSNTLYETQTRLGLDRDRTRELLSDLGVLDLVQGRISTRHERTVPPAEVGERIREHLS